MIEAVNTAIASASLLRGSVEQNTPLRSATKQVDLEPVEAPQAPYVSPYIFVNTQFDTAVLQIRDSDTGDVVDQFPRESTLEARRRAESLTQSDPVIVEVDSLDDIDSGQQRAQSVISSDIQLSSTISNETSTGVAQAQIASAALTAGSLAGQQTSSFSVFA